MTEYPAAFTELVEALGALNWVRSARLAPADDEAEVVRAAQASEALVVAKAAVAALPYPRDMSIRPDQHGAGSRDLAE